MTDTKEEGRKGLPPSTKCLGTDDISFKKKTLDTHKDDKDDENDKYRWW